MMLVAMAPCVAMTPCLVNLYSTLSKCMVSQNFTMMLVRTYEIELIKCWHSIKLHVCT